jgi:hypothetical protein
MKLLLQSHSPELTPLKYLFHFSKIVQLCWKIYVLMRENITSTQVSGSYYGQCLWSKFLIVCLPTFPSASPCYFSFCLFIHLILLYYCNFLPFHSNISFLSKQYAVSTFHSFQDCYPCMQQSSCIYSFIFFVRIHKQIIACCRNWNFVKDQLKGSGAHSVAWKIAV